MINDSSSLLLFSYFFLAHLLTPIKWRSCDENHDHHSNRINNNNNIEECQYLLPKNGEISQSSVATKIVHAADLELLVDYKFLAISIGLSFILAMSVDLTRILPTFLTVRELTDDLLMKLIILFFID